MLGTAALGLLLATPCPDPPLCRVQASSYPRPYLLDRRVIFSIRLLCAADGVARVRYASDLGGILPARPPSYLTLKPE